MKAHLLHNYRKGIESALTQDELQEFYRSRCSNDHSFRDGYNTSDILPDWVTDMSTNAKKRKTETSPVDWVLNNQGVRTCGDDLPEWVR